MKVDLLSPEDLFGKNKLDIFKNIGVCAALSDYAIILGCFTAPNNFIDEKFYPSNIGNLKERTCIYWTNSVSENKVRNIGIEGETCFEQIFCRDVGVRPVIKNFEYDESKVEYIDNIPFIEYGYYPQSIVDKTLALELEKRFIVRDIEKAEGYFTYDDISGSSKGFDPKINEIYHFDGKYFVRVVSKKSSYIVVLSNGDRIRYYNSYWFNVEPIKWILDKESHTLISRDVIISGIQYDSDSECKYEDSNIKKYLDNYFSKEIGIDIKKENEILLSNKLIKYEQPYDFDFSEVSEEEKIRGCVESDIPVFLHGRSSEGKSARVKQLDPDVTILYLRNASPESLNGKSVYNANTGEMIDVEPTWYKKLAHKCESEPDKIHILFFDELTNALPSIQGMAFNIILDKEVKGIWKLPKNARIVAAGNDMNDSLAANQMAEPLFNRFAHVYINTTLESWLNWATKKHSNKSRILYTEREQEELIHPSIVAFLVFKSKIGEDLLRTPYNGERPNADPRKWEMASKLLYRTNNPNMIECLLGEYITKKFVSFISTSVVSKKDILESNYEDCDINMLESTKYIAALALRDVSFDELPKARGFIEKLGSDVTDFFDMIWSRDDEKRVMYLKKLKN